MCGITVKGMEAKSASATLASVIFILWTKKILTVYIQPDRVKNVCVYI